MCEYFSLKIFAKNFPQKRMQIEVPDFIFIKTKLAPYAEHFIHLFVLTYLKLTKME